ncbi:hypothetical protein [uncultured Paraglaciecola sp.]|uniref:hypothetical protein n=1 Tax=uncultured Paraglaciecola sp. TaxID=1765024 RepID=UPI002620D515|nr:hypothetical protein [uncultured Paraglaciecola sp.]
MKPINFIIIAIFTCSLTKLHAQEHKNSLNFMNEQLSKQLLNQTLVLSEPKLVKAQAELLRQHYHALVQSGFSKDQALQLVIAIAARDKS